MRKGPALSQACGGTEAPPLSYCKKSSWPFVRTSRHPNPHQEWRAVDCKRSAVFHQQSRWWWQSGSQKLRTAPALGHWHAQVEVLRIFACPGEGNKALDLELLKDRMLLVEIKQLGTLVEIGHVRTRKHRPCSRGDGSITLKPPQLHAKQMFEAKQWSPHPCKNQEMILRFH